MDSSSYIYIFRVYIDYECVYLCMCNNKEIKAVHENERE